MAPKIKILPEELANKIAAGEIIERPASVVKELVENSVDAKARNIQIEIKGSGKQLIRVGDDGEGMERDDALMAFERYATSKISSLEDLYSLRSLGFRGEALPSIASIAHIRLSTCANDEGQGVRIELAGGKVIRVEEIGFPRGTTVEVRNLFFNTPARLKFLKSDTTELGHICQAVTQQSLVQPTLSFKLIHNNRPLMQLPAEKDHFSRLVALFGLDFARELLPLEITSRLFRAFGFISSPSSSYRSRRYQYVFLNGRFIRNRVIQQAISHAYNTCLPKDRHPAVFLFLEMDPARVDCNVHPTKIEVKLHQEAEVYESLLEGLRRNLWDEGKKARGLPRLDLKEEGPGFAGIKEEQGGYSGSGSRLREAVEQPLVGESRPASTLCCHEPWLPIGQIKNSFILIECGETLLIVDQHGAHERIIFERLRQGLATDSLGQQLLIKENIHLTRSESLVLEKHLEEFVRLGFELEPFGEGSYLIKAVPTVLREKDYKQVIRDLIEKLASWERMGSLSEVLEEMLMLMACHAAIKAHEPLQPQEMEALIQDLRDLGPSQTCPHGRPIIQSLSIEEIKRKFMRH